MDAWVEDERDGAGTRRRVTLDEGAAGRREVWLRVPAPFDAQLLERADAVAIISVFTAMRARKPLVIHGTVSPSLLRNLDEFQAAWAAWCPDRYARVEISAEIESEAPPAREPDRAVVAFSGGVDAAFTALRHQRGLCGRRSRHIGAGVMIHGYDIPAADEATFAGAFRRAERMSGALGFPLVPVATNYREVEPLWEDVHMACVAASLTLFQGSFAAGLVGSSEPYGALVLPWASNPVTDPLLSSDSFRIVHDGAEFDRVAKLRTIATWPEAAADVLVCWNPTADGRNCCACNKCIRTILNFRVLGLGRPATFERDVSEAQILGMRGLNDTTVADLDVVLRAAAAEGIAEPWVHAVRRVVRWYRIRRRWTRHPAVGLVRKTLNGSAFGQRIWKNITR